MMTAAVKLTKATIVSPSLTLWFVSFSLPQDFIVHLKEISCNKYLLLKIIL